MWFCCCNELSSFDLWLAHAKCIFVVPFTGQITAIKLRLQPCSSQSVLLATSWKPLIYRVILLRDLVALISIAIGLPLMAKAMKVNSMWLAPRCDCIAFTGEGGTKISISKSAEMWVIASEYNHKYRHVKPFQDKHSKVMSYKWMIKAAKATKHTNYNNS